MIARQQFLKMPVAMIRFARLQFLSTPGCTAAVHPHVQTLYTRVYKGCTPGCIRNLFTGNSSGVCFVLQGFLLSTKSFSVHHNKAPCLKG